MTARETKTLSFTQAQAKFVETCVSSGRYQSASEVVRAGLRLLELHEAQTNAAFERARNLIAEGAAQLDRGETVDGEEVFRRLEDKHTRLEARKTRRA